MRLSCSDRPAAFRAVVSRTSATSNALLILGGLVLVGLVLRLAVPRGIWLDEAITIHQARLSLHDLFQNLYNGDRQPPLYHLTLWATIRAFGHGEAAVRLPSLIAGTLLIPALYELARELYDRRTGLIAAAFAAVSPVLIWYSQEVRMYEFAALFGLLALLTQLRAIRNGTMLNWAAYILATAALLWSHYFGLVVIGVQQLIFVGVLDPPPARRRAGQAAGARCRVLVRRARDAAGAARDLRAPPVPGHHRSGGISERNLRPVVVLLDPGEPGLVDLGVSARRGDGAACGDVAAGAARLAGLDGARRLAPDQRARRGGGPARRCTDHHLGVRQLVLRGPQLPDPGTAGAAPGGAADHGLDPSAARATARRRER